MYLERLILSIKKPQVVILQNQNPRSLFATQPMIMHFSPKFNQDLGGLLKILIIQNLKSFSIHLGHIQFQANPNCSPPAVAKGLFLCYRRNTSYCGLLCGLAFKNSQPTCFSQIWFENISSHHSLSDHSSSMSSSDNNMATCVGDTINVYRSHGIRRRVRYGLCTRVYPSCTMAASSPSGNLPSTPLVSRSMNM